MASTQINLKPDELAHLIQLLNDAQLYDPDTNQVVNTQKTFPQGKVALFAPIYAYIFSIIDHNTKVVEDTQYWFRQAPAINADAGSVSDFIRNLTEYGLLYNGKLAGVSQSATDPILQRTSDLIGELVVDNILRDGPTNPATNKPTGGIPQFADMVSGDIAAAIGSKIPEPFRQTLGGWGGSFYYWTVLLPKPLGGFTSLGSEIQNGGPVVVNGETLNPPPASSINEFYYDGSGSLLDNTITQILKPATPQTFTSGKLYGTLTTGPSFSYDGSSSAETHSVINFDGLMTAAASAWTSLTNGVRASAPWGVKTTLLFDAFDTDIGRTLSGHSGIGFGTPTPPTVTHSGSVVTTTYSDGAYFKYDVNRGETVSWRTASGLTGTTNTNLLGAVTITDSNYEVADIKPDGDFSYAAGVGTRIADSNTGPDTLYGGSSNDTFVVQAGDRNVIDDSLGDGDGSVSVGSAVFQVKDANAGAQPDSWVDGSSTQYQFNVLTDQLTISGGSILGQGQLVIDNFNLAAAEYGSGYLGIQLPGNLKLAANTDSSPATSKAAGTNVTASGNEQTFTLTNGAASSTATTYTITATGSDLSQATLRYGTGEASLANGSATLTIPAGQDSVTVSLTDQNTSATAQSIQLTASTNGGNAKITSNALSVTFGGTPVPVTGTNITGVPGTLPSGSSATSPGITATAYPLDTQNDSITAGSGVNIIAAAIQGYTVVNDNTGNHFIITAGEGSAISAGSRNTNDTIAGGNGQDIISLSSGNNQVYAGAVVPLSTALNQAQTQTASNTKGDLIAVGNGNNTIVGGTGNDFIAVGTGNNTIVLGPGANTFFGGVGTNNACPDWSVGWNNAALAMSDVNVLGLGATNPAGYEGSAITINGTVYAFGSGNDTLYGGKGDSTYYLPNGNNYLDAGGGNDTIQASLGTSTIYGGSGNDLIYGGGGNNYINAESGNDLIAGEGGNSTIYGGTGNDTIYAGNNNDTTNSGNLQSWATSITTNNTVIDAGSGNDSLYGAGGNDTLKGGSGSDFLYAGSGNELLQAGTGATSMLGGAGNDTLIGGTGNDLIQAGSGTSLLQAGTGNTTMNGGTGDSTNKVPLNETLNGGSGDFFANATQNNGNVTINGGGGNTTIEGGSGNDVINVGDGGTDVNVANIQAGSGNTTITGGAGVDNIVGGTGTDVLNAGDGGDTGQWTQVKAGDGNTTINGGAGIDYLIAGSGSDVINAGDGGTADNATSLEGGSGSSTLTGGAGYDDFFAQGGNVTMVAGSGTNIFTGGPGQSVYQINSNAGVVTINSAQASDTLQFGTGINIANISFSSTQYINETVYTFTTSGGSTVTIAGGPLTQATFGDGTTATFAQLLSGGFTIGNTTYSSNSESLPTTSSNATPSTTRTPNGASAFIVQQVTGSQATQNLTLYGNGDLTGTGNNANDIITANSGSDTLIAGTANNTLIGGGASDDYGVSAGVGTTTVIEQSSGNDILAFATGISLSGLTATTTLDGSGNLDVTLQVAQGGSIVIDGALNSTVNGGNGSSTMLDTLTFGDGSVASLGEFVAQLTSGPTAAISATNVTLAGGIQNMTLTGSANISATGNAQADVMTAGNGNDTLIAGTGNDTLMGGSGHTTYALDAGNGNVVINQSASGDTLAFDNTVPENDLTTTSAVVNGATVVTIANNQGSTVTINGGGLNQVSFADGNTATLAQLLSQSYTDGSSTYSNVNATAGTGITSLVMTGGADVTATANNSADTLTANSGNDTLVAGTANDTLVGGGASDDYVIANGAQTTTLEGTGRSDTITFGTGASVVDLSATAVTASDGSLTVTLQNSLGGTVTVDEYSGDVSVDQITLANGSTTSLSAILAQATTGATASTSASNVTLGEFVQNMQLTGSASATATANDKDDVITSNSGNDTLIAGTGADTLIGGPGATTYEVDAGDGNLTIANSGNADTLVFGSSVSESDLYATSATVNGATVVTISDSQGSTVTIEGGGLSKLSFANGDTPTLAQLLGPSYTEGTTLYANTNVTAASGIVDVYLTGSGNITAIANTSNGDRIQANSGNDTLEASVYDTLVGGGGNDTFEIGLNAAGEIDDSTQNDVIQYLNGSAQLNTMSAIASSAVNGSTLVTLSDGANNTLTIDGTLGGMVDQIDFTGGATGSLGAILAQSTSGITAASSAVSVALGASTQNMTLTGTANLIAAGNNLDDVITANSGNDTLIAGTAQDTLVGGGNAVHTVYQINQGAGSVVIKNSGSNDVVQFGAGILPANVTASYALVNDVTVVTLTDTGVFGPIVINSSSINQFEFSNGTTETLLDLLPANGIVGNTEFSNVSTTLGPGLTNLTLTQSSNITGTGNNLNDVIIANNGNDTLVSGSGNDVLYAGTGNDVLVSGTAATTMYGDDPTGKTGGAATFVLSNGNKGLTVNNAGPLDTLEVGTGFNLGDLLIQSLSGNEVMITGSANRSDVIEINGPIGYMSLADGTTFSFASYNANQYFVDGSTEYAAVSATLQPTLTNLTLNGSGNYTATANSLNDTMQSNLAGNDSLVAGSGNDTLIAEQGKDTLVGGSGNTTFVVNSTSIYAMAGTITQSNPNEMLYLQPGGLVPAGSSSAAYELPDSLQLLNDISSGVVSSGMTTLSGGAVEVTIGNLNIVSGSNGMLSQVNFADGSSATLGQIVAAGTANVQTSATSVTLPVAVSAMTLTGSANLTATGNGLDDLITANSGNDTLIAGSGYDTFVGGSGATTIQNASYNDTLSYQNLINEYGNILPNAVTATESTVNGQTVVTLTANQGGSFVIDGTSMNVAFSDGTYTLAQLLGQSPVPVRASSNTTLAGGATNLTLTGTGNLTATGNSLDDVITANSGNDTLIAGAGYATTLVGGSGNDTFVLGNVNPNGNADVIEKGVNSGSNTEVVAFSAVLAANVQNLTGFGGGALSLTGNNLNNVITDTSGNAVLIAGSGLATLVGGGSGDFFAINNANDVIEAGGNASNKNYEWSSVSTTVAGNVQTLFASMAPNMTLTANSLNDTIYSGSANDTLVSGSGNDTLYGFSYLFSGSTNAAISNALGSANPGNFIGANEGSLSAVARGEDMMEGGNGGITTYAISANAGNYYSGGDQSTIVNSQSGDTLQLDAIGANSLATMPIAGNTQTVNGTTIVTLYLPGNTSVEIKGGALTNVNVPGLGKTTISQLLAQNAAVYSSTSATLPATTGTAIGNLVLTGTANLTGTATSGSNIITANSGNDTLVAGTGADTLVGGSGNDTFMVQNSYAVVDEAPNSGANTEEATASVTLAQNVQNLTGIGSANLYLTGNNLTNVITANSGNDVLQGGTGSTTLVGGMGNDTMYGIAAATTVYQVNAGVGATTISGSYASDVLSFGTGITAANITATSTGSGSSQVVTLAVSGGKPVTIDAPLFTTVTFVGGTTTTIAALLAANTSVTSSTSIVMPASATKLTLTGTGSISGTGNSLADTIIANSGNDSLIAGSGLATLVGGSGNDTFEVNNTADVIQQATANAADVVQSTANYTLPANLSILSGTGSNSITLTGNSLADKITANSGNDTLVAGSGVATLTGGAGNDTFIVDNSSDSISVGTAKTGNVVQSSVTYVLPANLLNLTGIGSNAISLTGNASADTITANSGNDTLTAGSGLATLIGGAGNDIFVVNNAGDIITKAANSGNNTEQTSVSITLAANIQNLTGTSTGSISLTGNSLANTITANSGNDTLTAGSGIATLVGGAGNDTFVVNNGSDVITVSTAKTGNVTQSTVSFVLPANLLNLTGTSTGSINLTGNTLADTITANSGNDTLTSGSGIDTLVAGAGNDTFIINNSSDAITASTAKAGNVTQTNVSYVLPANLLNLTALGSASLALTGNASADIITANGGNDTLTAGAGLATLVGGAGNDTFVINSASDVITVSTAKAGNVVQSSVSYTLGANLMSLTGGGTGSISLTGNMLADTITANSGNDTLTAGSGIATLVGGAGNDIFVVNNAGDTITVSTAKAGNVVQSSVSYVLPANLLALTGTGSNAINLTGNTLADTITANSGNDTLTSGTGIDTLVGAAGNDTFIVNNSSDAITVSSAKAGNVVQSSVNYVLPTNLLSLTGTGTNAISLTGNASADTITANSGNDTLTAGAGLATLIGGAGNDTFVVNNASDVITEAVNTGNNTESTTVAVTLAANVQNLVATGTTAIKLTGNSGNDVITGNSGNDTLAAGAGNDTLIAGTGSTKTTMTGGAGNDTFVINNASDTITATAGSNINAVQTSVSFTAPTNVQDLFGTGSGAITLTGNTGSNLLIGNSGNDTLTAGSGVTVIEAGSGTDVLKDTASANVLIGGSGNDSLTGGTGTSFIVGGAGNDAITLGAGTAVVAFNTGAGKATIAPGTGVSNVLSLGGGIAYANLAFSKSGNNLILNTGGNNAITFTNWYAASADKNFVTLQVIEQSAATYSSTSSNTLYSSEVEEFNFTQLVTAFNAALTANPSLTSWSLSNALLTDHLSSSNTSALGGDLAYYDGLNGNLTGMNLTTAVTTLQSSTFGKTAQTIDAWSGISNGTNKLH